MANKLEHLKEFQEVLRNYRISAGTKETLSATKLVLLVGPTSSGRNTIIGEILKTGKYHYIISDTTRKIRHKNGTPIEKHGREYWFRSEEDVLDDLKQGKFVEAALIHNQQVSGSNIREYEAALRADQIAITDVEPQGAETIHRLKPDAMIMFVVPPNFATWMQRLDGRGKMARAEKRRRLESAPKEFEAALTNKYYTFIVNDAFEHSVERIHQLVFEGRHDPEHQTRGRHITEELLIETQAYLRSNT